MDTFISDLGSALRYGITEANALSFGTPLTREAGAITHQAALGDNIALAALADMLRENDHPAAPFLEKIRDGHAVEGEWFEHNMLGLMHATRGGKYTRPYDYFVLPTDEHKNPETGVGSVGYLHLPSGHFMQVALEAGVKNEGDQPVRRSWLLPASEEEVKEYAAGLGKMQGNYPNDIGSEAHFHKALKEQPEPPDDSYHRRLRNAGLGHLAPPESADDYAADISEVLKYVSWDKPTDVYPQLLQEPLDAHLHAVYADWLQDRAQTPEDHQLAERVRREAHKSLLIDRPLKPAKLNDDASLHDFVLHAIRTGHQNPTVRAMAGERIGDTPHPELINLLLHSDHPYDQDVAIWLAPEDAKDSHAAHSRLKRINSRANEEAGLQAKVVRGTVYLLDHEVPDHRAYGAPSILFTAPVNDHSELDELEAHAQNVRAERTAAGPATHIGPASFGS